MKTSCLLLSFATLISLGACSTAQKKEPVRTPLSLNHFSWITVGANHQEIVRSRIDSTECPRIFLDGVPHTMNTRQEANADPVFPQKVCEYVLNSKTKTVSIEKQPLSRLKKNPKKILILGDSGCRIKGKDKDHLWIQDCNDPKAWPFEKIISAAANLKPDLVIHTGDYFYRESCPSGVKECEGSPLGDRQETWDADFFEPAQKLLIHAPWIFVRGNHESCARGNQGFRKFLDSEPLTSTCNDTPDPYLIRFKNIQFAVLDSSFKDHSKERLSSLEKLKLKNTVLLTHRPLWTPEMKSPIGKIPGVKLTIHGHEHLFHYAEFKDKRGSQLIVGNSGTILEKQPIEGLDVGTKLDQTEFTESVPHVEFGFSMLVRKNKHWVLESYNADGEILFTKKLKI